MAHSFMCAKLHDSKLRGGYALLLLLLACIVALITSCEFLAITECTLQPNTATEGYSTACVQHRVTIQ
jgi:hypothetical protein